MDSPVAADDTQAEVRGRGYVVTCPHCGREVPGNMSDMHASVCAHRPAMKAAILATITSDVPGVGIPMQQYEKRRHAHGALHLSTLLRNYGGTWPAVLDAFGLALPEDQRKRRPARTEKQQRMTPAQREQAACADVAAQHAAMRSVLETERNRQYGIEVCRIVSEPGLRINGNECVRLVLR